MGETRRATIEFAENARWRRTRTRGKKRKAGKIREKGIIKTILQTHLGGDADYCKHVIRFHGVFMTWKIVLRLYGTHAQVARNKNTITAGARQTLLRFAFVYVDQYSPIVVYFHGKCVFFLMWKNATAGKLDKKQFSFYLFVCLFSL